MREFWKTQRVLAVGIIAGMAVLGIWCIPLFIFGFQSDVQIGQFANNAKETQGVSDAIEELMTRRGTFGDMFGGVTSLFSALTVIGVAIGVALQTQELAETKRALADTSYENQFFQLLELLKNAQDGILIARTNGMGAFEVAFYNIHAADQRIRGLPALIEEASGLYKTTNNALFNYFNTLYIIVDHVFSRPDPPAPFVRLIRAQIKPNQAIAMAILGLAEGRTSLKSAIEKCGLLACLKNDNGFRVFLGDEYSPSAYGE